MRAHSPPDPEELEAAVDHRIVLRGLSWQQFEQFLQMRGDHGPRLAFLRGDLELMSPGWNHESLKKLIARLLELWALETETRITGVGSWLLKQKLKKLGLEPDECYILGDRKANAPDLAIEVAWSHWSVDKMEIYRGLGIPEVWIWKRPGAIEVQTLSKEGYRKSSRSALLPYLDLSLFNHFVRLDVSQTDAVLEYRAALRRETGAPSSKRAPRRSRSQKKLH